MIDYASIALIAEAVSWLATAVIAKASASALADYAWTHSTHKVNNKVVHYNRATASRQDKLDIANIVDKTQKSVLASGIILGLAFLLLAFMIRRMRGAAPARWSVVIVAVLTQAPLSVLVISSDLPTGIKAAQFLIGVFSIAALVLLFLPESRAYFREVRESLAASMPPRQPRPAGGGLFGSRRLAAPPTPAQKPEPQKVTLTKDGGSDAKAAANQKRRAEADAIAKGAALARSRAKAAAKSRRTDD